MRFKFLKTTLAGLMLSVTLLGNVANASLIDVVWDPTSLFDFTSSSQNVLDLLDPGLDGVFGTGDDVVSSLNGFGKVTGLNGTFQSTFCPSDCELTYEFGGYEVVSVIVGADTLVGFTGGWFNFYVDSVTAYAANDMSTATDGGAPWLSLAAHETFSFTHGIMTSLNATFSDFGRGLDAGVGAGLLDVVGGMAAANFDTNTQADGADWVFSHSFQPIGATTNDGFELFGTADFRGDSVSTSVTVPEPSTLAIFALGMICIAFRRFKKIS
jgi:hypothetical protein